MSFEGWQFKLEIRDKSEEIWSDAQVGFAWYTREERAQLREIANDRGACRVPQ